MLPNIEIYALSGAVNVIVFMMAVFNLVFSGIIYIHGKRTATEIFFALIAFFISIWSIATLYSSFSEPNYLLLQITAPLHYIAGQLAYFSFFWFSIFYIVTRSKSTFWPILVTFINLVASIIILTPSAFFEAITPGSSLGARISFNPAGHLYYSLVLAITFLVTEVILVKKYKKASQIDKQRLKYLIYGTLLAGTLGLFFNVLLPGMGIFAFFLISPVFVTVFFTGMSLYALVKYKLFEIKIVAAEFFVILLTLTLLIRTIVSSNPSDTLINIFSLLISVGFGILLIRSVIKEVKQREQLQILTGQLKEVNKQLKIMDRARAEFITMASHQLRTPPSTIKWYMAALLNDEFGKLSPELRDTLTKLNLTNDSLISVIEAMLNVSRIERGKLEFNFQTTNVEEITRLTVDQLMPLAMQKNLRLQYMPPKEKIPEIIADTEKVRQVINNFIDNAIKYTKVGFVKVTVAIDGGDIVVKVSDSGKGIEKGTVDNLFAKFGRGKDSKKYSAGLGLGLYLAKIIIDQHKGSIWAESNGVNEGSTFAFSLPIKNNLKKSAEFDLTVQ